MQFLKFFSKTFRVEHLGCGAGHVLYSIGHGVGADLGQQCLGLGLVGRIGGVEGGQDAAPACPRWG